MIWSFSGPNLDDIKRLATKEDTTLEEVLEDSCLSQALRYETEQVISFLSRSENMTRLLEWSLTDKFKDNWDSFYKLSTLSTSVLTNRSADFETALADHAPFVDFLNGFFSSEAIKSPVLCGHYAMVLEHYITCTRGEILEHMDNLARNVCNNVDVLGIRVLAGRLMTTLKDYGVNCEDMVQGLARKIRQGGVAGASGMSVIRDVIREKKGALVDADVTEAVRAMLEYGNNRENPALYRAEAFVTVDLVLGLFRVGDFDDVLAEFEASVDFDEEGMVGNVVFLVYRSKLGKAWERFIKNPANAFVGKVVLEGLEAMDIPTLVAFVNEAGMVDSIVDKYSVESKCTGYLTQISILLNNVPDIRDNDKWKEFSASVLQEHIEWMSACDGYGGEHQDAIADPEPTFERVPRRKSSERARDEGSFNFDTDSSDDSSEEGGLDIKKCCPTQKIQNDKNDGSVSDDGYEEEEERAQFRGQGRRTDEEEEQEEEEEMTESQRQYYEAMRELLG